jgi:hydrogenase maturation protein HypF
MSRSAWHLRIRGQVQGVGFRPFVCRLAGRMGLAGRVWNAADGVHVQFSAEADAAEAFRRAVAAEAPPLARITSSVLEAMPEQAFAGFEVVHSEPGADAEVLLTPDAAMCADCRAELHDPAGRRHGYAFITCTSCGPRFTIAQALPYDRERTTMAPFAQCPACEAEYGDLADRRYYSQTNSCPACGIRLSAPPGAAAEWLRAGEIVAVKGIGGFLLLCDARNPAAIQRLRTRKHRPAKPCAVLYPDAELLAGDTVLSEEARSLLGSPESPIVILPLRAQPASGICAELLAPGLDHLGAMLPYAPLLELIAAAFGAPLLATSGNLSGSPIACTDAQALEYLGSVADRFLTHNREIVAPVDDSVLRLAPFSGTPILLRRSRGYAPSFLPPQPPAGPATLAFGADLKSAFAWSRKGNCYISPFLGDLESCDTQEQFEAMLRHLMRLFGAQPERLAADLHPEYYSVRLAERLALEWGLPLARIPHHEAHLAAVLGEQEAWPGAPVLGVVWDGAGYGPDGQIWGGEFIRYDQERFGRTAHLAYFQVLSGDTMAREPRLAALSLIGDRPEAGQLLQPKFSGAAWQTYQRLRLRSGQPLTSSMGRLFDAAASVTGICDLNRYEGEAAMRLEAAALREFRRQGLARIQPFGLEGAELLDPAAILCAVAQGCLQGHSADLLAARFHRTLVETVRHSAREAGCRILAFSGGVFQNGLLCDLLRHFLAPEGWQLCFHRSLSPNDECIAFGQLMHLQRISHPVTSPDHVSGHSW